MKALVDGASRIAICTHVHPDGDALGSSSAVWHWLKSLGKDATLICEAPPKTISFIIDGVPFVDLLTEEEKAAGIIGGCDLVICTDFNKMERSAGAEPYIKASKAPKILIDHHEKPETEYFDVVFSEMQISSASELVYWTLKEICEELPLRSLEAIMCGMTTDTNNFANSVFPSTLRMAGELLAAGVDRDAIINSLYNSGRENKLRAVAYVMGNVLKIRPDGVATIIVTSEIWHRFGLMDGELEGMVNIPLGIKEVNYVIYLREDQGQFRVSIRSKKGFSSLALAEKYFHGGGHFNASGGKLFFPEDIATPDLAQAYLDNIRV